MHCHQLRSQVSQVFQGTSHVVWIFALHFVSPIQLLSLYQFFQFLTCTRIPCRDSHCENGLVRCLLSLHLRRHTRATTGTSECVRPQITGHVKPTLENTRSTRVNRQERGVVRRLCRKELRPYQVCHFSLRNTQIGLGTHSEQTPQRMEPKRA